MSFDRRYLARTSLYPSHQSQPNPEEIMLALAAATTGFTSPSASVSRHSRIATSPLADRCASGLAMKATDLSNNPDFLSDPVQYISENPDKFDDDMKKMAQFQLLLSDARLLNMWGDLPEELDLNGHAAHELREKSARADGLAKIILCANAKTMKELASDATFEEKKALFEALAALPEEDLGIKNIQKTVSKVIDWGDSGPQAQFGRDLEYVTQKVAEANSALMQFEQTYSTLFLSVRKVMKLTCAATGEPFPASGERQGGTPPPMPVGRGDLRGDPRGDPRGDLRGDPRGDPRAGPRGPRPDGPRMARPDPRDGPARR